MLNDYVLLLGDRPREYLQIKKLLHKKTPGINLGFSFRKEIDLLKSLQQDLYGLTLYPR